MDLGTKGREMASLPGLRQSLNQWLPLTTHHVAERIELGLFFYAF